MPASISKEVSSPNNTLVELVAHLLIAMHVGDPTSLFAGDIDMDEFELSVCNA